MDSKQRVAIVVAHELAHQWFGNLVVSRNFLFASENRKLFHRSQFFRRWTGGPICVSEEFGQFFRRFRSFSSGLNEGFASWIEYLAVDKIYPEFDIWTQFVADTFARFLVPDALRSSHPIEVPIGSFKCSSFSFVNVFDGF